jgi:hypothetical protein
VGRLRSLVSLMNMESKHEAWHRFRTFRPSTSQLIVVSHASYAVANVIPQRVESSHRVPGSCRRALAMLGRFQRGQGDNNRPFKSHYRARQQPPPQKDVECSYFSAPSKLRHQDRSVQQVSQIHSHPAVDVSYEVPLDAFGKSLKQRSDNRLTQEQTSSC